MRFLQKSRETKKRLMFAEIAEKEAKTNEIDFAWNSRVDLTELNSDMSQTGKTKRNSHENRIDRATTRHTIDNATCIQQNREKEKKKEKSLDLIRVANIKVNEIRVVHLFRHIL